MQEVLSIVFTKPAHFKKWERWYFSSKKKKKNDKMIFSLAWIFSMEYHVYWSLKSCSCFKLFGDEKYGIFWAKTLTERWTLLITKKFLLWLFWWWEIRSFFESKSWWKDDIYWLLRSSFFKLFGDGKYGLFSAKILMERWYLLRLFELFMIQQW